MKEKREEYKNNDFMLFQPESSTAKMSDNNCNMPKKHTNAKENRGKYLCTLCGSDVTISFQGAYNEKGLDSNGHKNPFKKTDRPCFACYYNKTGLRLF